MAMNHSKLSLAVIFGGVSSEHEVSRMSATSILENLSPEQYDVHMVGITKKGQWLLYTGEVKDILSGAWEQGPVAPAFLSPDPTVHGLVVLRDGKAETLRLDVIFPALHGKNGEDGTIQGLFQLSQIPYVGCDTESSAICMDKAVTHTLLSAADIEQAHYLWFYADRFDAAPDTIKKKIKARLDFPVFVKPANAGSSVGISKAADRAALDTALDVALREDDKVVFEEFIDGQEVECAAIGNPDDPASVSTTRPGEILAGAEFYTYDDKYKNGVSQTVIPAHLSEEKLEEVQAEARKAYLALGCAGLSRCDFFVERGTGRVLCNELNTLPGFTAISMYPKLMEHEGLTFSQLVDRLLQLAVNRRKGAY